MRVTFSLDDNLVKAVRKIAAQRGTTLNDLVRTQLKELAAQHANRTSKAKQLEALERSFERFQFSMGKRTWKREDLYERR